MRENDYLPHCTTREKAIPYMTPDKWDILIDCKRKRDALQVWYKIRYLLYVWSYFPRHWSPTRSLWTFTKPSSCILFEPKCMGIIFSYWTAHDRFPVNFCKLDGAGCKRNKNSATGNVCAHAEGHISQRPKMQWVATSSTSEAMFQSQGNYAVVWAGLGRMSAIAKGYPGVHRLLVNVEYRVSMSMANDEATEIRTRHIHIK